jgi:hypothetical protein
MSEVKVNKISPRTACGTVTLGDSGDTFTIPSGATISNLGTATGFGGTGVVSWDTASIKTTGFTAVTGTGYFCNTTGGAFTVTLPLSPSAGDVVGVSDYAKQFADNNLTLGRNSSNIGGAAIDSTLVIAGAAVTLVYVDGTKGWIVTDSGNQTEAGNTSFVAATGGCITTCGNFKVHTFTGPGALCVTCAGHPSGSTTVDYMVVAGGAGGGSGSGNQGGAGGAGGFRESPGTASGCYTVSPLGAAPAAAIAVTASPYPITIGAGGAALVSPSWMPCAQGNPGSNSIFSTITSAGGGGGGRAGNTPPTVADGLAGGSGGGSGGGNATSTGGAGNTPPTSPNQGFAGGGITSPHAPDLSSPGGGGAGAVGGNVPSPPSVSGGPGGAGVTTSINFTATGFSGGGGGGAYCGSKGNDHSWPNGRAATPGVAACAAAGYGGGTGGSYSPILAGTDGSTNKGGGGGGSGQCATGGGGSGVVIIRYKYQ